MSDLTLEQLEELERLEREATAGDWQANAYVAGPQKDNSIIEMDDGVGCDFYGPRKFANAELVAAAQDSAATGEKPRHHDRGTRPDPTKNGVHTGT